MSSPIASRPLRPGSTWVRPVRRAVAVAAAVMAVGGVVAAADEVRVDAPVLSDPIRRGGYSVTAAQPLDPARPPHVIDGDLGDWVGTGAGFGGTTRLDRGELVYQDHLFDAYGADDGRDRARLAALGVLEAADKGARRLELVEKYAAAELGAPDEVADAEQYGDLAYQEAADLRQVSVAVEDDGLYVGARFTTMTEATSTPALLILVDTGGEEWVEPRAVGLGSGLRTTRADLAVLVDGDGGFLVSDIASQSTVIIRCEGPCPVLAASDGTGWGNGVETKIWWDLLGLDGPNPVAVAVASGTASATGPFGLADVDGDGAGDVANVAFRAGAAAEEPATWWDRRQALSLLDGTIDPFFADVDPAALDPGITEQLRPLAGYHDRQLTSTEAISVEAGTQGIWQHYGLYLPEAYAAGQPHPVQWWFHWRGGEAHTASTVIPDMFRQLGDELGTIVVAPRGRGTSTWYVGRGHVDFGEVWDDVHALLGADLDRSREYVTGHSMGGWASWLLPIVYPDRFAASAPFAGPVTMGAWTGLDVAGCDGWQFDEYTPCYIEANGSRPRDQHTLRLLENLRDVPMAVFQGAADELVPVAGVTRQVARLAELGYDHRYYLSPTYEHYSHPVMDQWAEAGRYLHQFQRPAQPPQVTLVRDLAFEEATEQVQSGGVPLDFTFDRSGWVSGLEVSAAATDRRALVDAITRWQGVGRTYGADVGPPATGDQLGPFVVAGFRRSVPVSVDPSDLVTARLAGAGAVTLDLVASGNRADAGGPVAVLLQSDRAAEVRLLVGAAPAAVAACGSDVTWDGGSTVTVRVPAGAEAFVVIDGDGAYACE